MDAFYSQESAAPDSAYNPQILNEIDQPMGGTEEVAGNGYSNGHRSHQVSQSADYPQSGQPISPPLDSDAGSRYNSPNLAYQQQSTSRPGSSMAGQQGYQGQHQDQNRQQSTQNKSSVVIKVGMVGDAQIGKTSLMVKYVEGSWDEDYIQTLGWWKVPKMVKASTDHLTGVNFMEKTISIRNTEITFSIWDLGGQREFVNMLPLVCNDAVAILFMFDLTRKSTLNSIKEWYRQGRGFNKTAIPFLIGTKYDHFVNFPREDQEEISTQVRF
jgi:GTP-binding protein of the ras superfamily involved in termination of M-phase